MDYADSHPHHHEIVIDEHIKLIEPQLAHAEASLSWTQSPEVIQYMGADFSHPTLEGETKRIQEILNNQDEYSWMIELDSVVIGNVSINSISEKSQQFGVKTGNLTIIIGAKEHWGKGIGFNVCSAVLAWAFEEAGFEAMAARALQENTGSIKTLRKLGFEEIGSEPYEGSVNGKQSMWRNFTIERRQWN